MIANMIADLKSGAPDKETLAQVESFLDNHLENELRSVFVCYLKFVPSPNYEKVIRFARESSNVYLVSETLKILDYRNHLDLAFLDLIQHCFHWPHTDDFQEVEEAAVRRMPKYFSVENVRETLIEKLESKSPKVRDAAAEVLQAYSGIPPSKIYSGNGDGDLLSKLPPERRSALLSN